jgi:RNA polymerase sigma-70 factor (ECF subfamily)
MVDAPIFDELIRRVRAGNQDAATELLRPDEPAIRGAGCFLLADASLRILLDSIDISQSVMASFFIRAASGQYLLETPAQFAP